MKKYLLIETDGYSINSKEFTSKEDAYSQMKKEFDEYMSGDEVEDYDDIVYIADTAACFANGDVYIVWTIQTVSFKETLEEQLARYRKDVKGDANGGIVAYNPITGRYIAMNYGDGSNLSSEDYADGFDDYVYITTYEFDGSSFEEYD